jgi:hypothetical protein
MFMHVLSFTANNVNLRSCGSWQILTAACASVEAQSSSEAARANLWTLGQFLASQLLISCSGREGEMSSSEETFDKGTEILHSIDIFRQAPKPGRPK